jgi:predicted membrane metal-binding protein
MINLIGLASRILPNLPFTWVKMGGWLIFASTIASLGWLRHRDRERLCLDHLGIAVALGLLTVPHLHFHDLSLLALPLLLTASNLGGFRKVPGWVRAYAPALVVVFASSILLISDLVARFWQDLIVYGWVGGCLLALLQLRGSLTGDENLISREGSDLCK